MMRVLVVAGVGAFALVMPLTLAIVAVLAIVATSYRQTIKAYPNGASSYIVASDNLGAPAGLVAAGALLIDYTLTVAVSVSAAWRPSPPWCRRSTRKRCRSRSPSSCC